MSNSIVKYNKKRVQQCVSGKSKKYFVTLKDGYIFTAGDNKGLNEGEVDSITEFYAGKVKLGKVQPVKVQPVKVNNKPKTSKTGLKIIKNKNKLTDKQLDVADMKLHRKRLEELRQSKNVGNLNENGVAAAIKTYEKFLG